MIIVRQSNLKTPPGFERSTSWRSGSRRRLTSSRHCGRPALTRCHWSLRTTALWVTSCLRQWWSRAGGNGSSEWDWLRWPCSALPAAGIGLQLVRRGLDILRERGCPFVVVVGHPEFYPRFGFEPASIHGLACQWEGVPDAAFMVLVLDEPAMAGVSAWGTRTSSTRSRSLPLPVDALACECACGRLSRSLHDQLAVL